MSRKVQSAIWKHSKHKGSCLLLMLAIGHYADDDGVACASIPQLSQMIRMSDRGTQYMLDRLGRSKEIKIQRNAGEKGCNLFTISGAIFAGANFAPGVQHNFTPNGENFAPVVQTLHHPEKKEDREEKKVIKEKKRQKKERDPSNPEEFPITIHSPRPLHPSYGVDFEEFWKGSTKRGSKLDAWKAWRKWDIDDALRLEIEGAMARWRTTEQWQDETKQPHVSTWLNRRGWEEIIPRNSNGKTKVDRTIENAQRLRDRLDNEDRRRSERGAERGDHGRVHGTADLPFDTANQSGGNEDD